MYCLFAGFVDTSGVSSTSWYQGPSLEIASRNASSFVSRSRSTSRPKDRSSPFSSITSATTFHRPRVTAARTGPEYGSQSETGAPPRGTPERFYRERLNSQGSLPVVEQSPARRPPESWNFLVSHVRFVKAFLWCGSGHQELFSRTARRSRTRSATAKSLPKNAEFGVWLVNPLFLTNASNLKNRGLSQPDPVLTAAGLGSIPNGSAVYSGCLRGDLHSARAGRPAFPARSCRLWINFCHACGASGCGDNDLHRGHAGLRHHLHFNVLEVALPAPGITRCAAVRSIAIGMPASERIFRLRFGLLECLLDRLGGLLVSNFFLSRRRDEQIHLFLIQGAAFPEERPSKNAGLVSYTKTERSLVRVGM